MRNWDERMIDKETTVDIQSRGDMFRIDVGGTSEPGIKRVITRFIESLMENTGSRIPPQIQSVSIRIREVDQSINASDD